MRRHNAIIIALLLGACASPPSIQPITTFEQTAYVAGGRELQIKAVIQSNEQPVAESTAGLSRPIRIYWFFGGR